MIHVMAERETMELRGILRSSRIEDWEDFSDRYSQDMDWRGYFIGLLEEKAVERSECIRRSGLEIHYAYQILSGTRNPSRDKLIALSIGGRLSGSETDRCLEKAGFMPLYPKNARDSLIACALNSGMDSVVDVNMLLAEKGLAPLE